MMQGKGKKKEKNPPKTYSGTILKITSKARFLFNKRGGIAGFKKGGGFATPQFMNLTEGKGRVCIQWVFGAFRDFGWFRGLH